ncbi:hypothetical protein [Clostridium sp. C105KSO13]|nr:hypothetical protein [Clostridium sp. C105KSO13]CUX30329.1 hypothetical protein BN3456_01242 [Clostridium sp. C105KSO13]
MRKRGWKEYVRRKMYVKPEMNRKLMHLKGSLEEVFNILNNGRN